MTKKHLPVKTDIKTEEIQSTIKDVLFLDDFPEDKKVEVEVEFTVVPKTMNIKISKK